MMKATLCYILVHLYLASNATNAIVPKHPSHLNKDSTTKYIYITFDDGPLPGTANCIAICKQQNIPASFFEVGLHQGRSVLSKGLYAQIQNDSLFALCNHSFTHANGKYKYFYHHPAMAFNDFMKAQKSLEVKNNIIRLPGNSAWNITQLKKASGLVKPVVQKLDSAGFNVIGWDVEWGFNKNGQPRQSPKFVMDLIDSAFAKNHTTTKNHLVILMHDHMFRAPADAAKLDTLIGLLKSNTSYQFKKITAYPGLINDGR